MRREIAKKRVWHRRFCTTSLSKARNNREPTASNCRGSRCNDAGERPWNRKYNNMECRCCFHTNNKTAAIITRHLTCFRFNVVADIHWGAALRCDAALQSEIVDFRIFVGKIFWDTSRGKKPVARVPCLFSLFSRICWHVKLETRQRSDFTGLDDCVTRTTIVVVVAEPTHCVLAQIVLSRIEKNAEHKQDTHHWDAKVSKRFLGEG